MPDMSHLEVATQLAPIDQQVDEIATWLAGDSGVPYEHIVDELTAWADEIRWRALEDASRAALNA